MAASFQEGCPGRSCWRFLLALFLAPPGEEGGASGLSDLLFPSGFVTLHPRRLSMKAASPPLRLPDDVLWVVV